MGIEPTREEWKSSMRPIHHTRVCGRRDSNSLVPVGNRADCHCPTAALKGKWTRQTCKAWNFRSRCPIRRLGSSWRGATPARLHCLGRIGFLHPPVFLPVGLKSYRTGALWEMDVQASLSYTLLPWAPRHLLVHTLEGAALHPKNGANQPRVQTYIRTQTR